MSLSRVTRLGRRRKIFKARTYIYRARRFARNSCHFSGRFDVADTRIASTHFHKANLFSVSSAKDAGSRVASHRDDDDNDVPRRLLNSLRARARARALFLIPRRGITFDRTRNVRDKLHEHMPYDVTENGRVHLFSFSGHVTTASARHILCATLYIHTYTHVCIHALDVRCAMRYSSRSRLYDGYPASTERHV